MRLRALADDPPSDAVPCVRLLADGNLLKRLMMVLIVTLMLTLCRAASAGQDPASDPQVGLAAHLIRVVKAGCCKFSPERCSGSLLLHDLLHSCC